MWTPPLAKAFDVIRDLVRGFPSGAVERPLRKTGRTYQIDQNSSGERQRLGALVAARPGAQDHDQTLKPDPRPRPALPNREKTAMMAIPRRGDRYLRAQLCEVGTVIPTRNSADRTDCGHWVSNSGGRGKLPVTIHEMLKTASSSIGPP